MNSKFDSLIQISGICENFPLHSQTFKQLHIHKIHSIKENKPSIKEILRVSVICKINDSKLINSCKGLSKEGQALTGSQGIVRGELLQKIEYISDNTTSSIQVTQLTIPFSTFIVLDDKFTLNSNFKVNPYIEDIYINQISKRKIFSSIMMILDINNS